MRPTRLFSSFGSTGEQLQINQPKVYDCAVPGSLASRVPALAAVCEKRSLRPASNRSAALTSKGGASFISFAKGAAFNDDLYHSWVAPALKSDLLVQFWIRSPGVLPSNCSLGWRVWDVQRIRPGQASAFRTSQDHSKWAVSPGAGLGLGLGLGLGRGGGWVCVGDINRNRAEERRGGGTVCLQQPQVWKAYRDAVLEWEACGG
ncbi:unnamed protein product [Menidia menidia]|uniref:Deoxyribonuclease-2-alpha n=1 Tax=Menidia menidia TaxID=238744 RepID=A0A8S4BJK1_9TELE|nr:unnamed protein product [Menidia menidia]